MHKRTEATVKSPDGSVFKVTKGAPQVILALAANAEAGPRRRGEAIQGFAARGFRSLGVARTDGRASGSSSACCRCSIRRGKTRKRRSHTAQSMGSRVKMVTGDQLAIAKEIAKQLGLGTNILDAAMFGDTSHHEGGQLADAIERADGFAQVYPEHKYHIVDVLQQRGHIVGMTGDGVNDAPALKKADAGIAVSGATDAARAAADIVLLSPGLSVIIKAIQESRKIFQRMNSYAIYRIAETIRVLLFMTLSILVFNFYPVTAVMIVLLALLNDGPILAIAYDRTRYSERPGEMEHALVLGISSILGLAGRGRLLRSVLPRRACSSHLDRGSDPDVHVPEAGRGRPPDDLHHPHARAVLVDRPGADPALGGGRAPSCWPRWSPSTAWP